MNWYGAFNIAFFALVFLGPVIAMLVGPIFTRRRLRRRLSEQAERSGLAVNSILTADRAEHPWPKIRIVRGGIISTAGSGRGTTFHFLLFVTNDSGVEMELWARYERSPIPFVFGPPITEWRPPLDQVANADAPIEPFRDEKKVVERAKFGPFAQHRSRRN